MTDDAVRQWLDWAAWVVGPDPIKQRRAAEAALAAEAAGLSFAEACELAREAAGLQRLRAAPQAPAAVEAPAPVTGAAADSTPVASLQAPAPGVTPEPERLPRRSTARSRARRKPALPPPSLPRPAFTVHRSVPRAAVWVALGALILLVAATAYSTGSPPSCAADQSQVRAKFIAAHDIAVPQGDRAISALQACDTLECLRAPALQLARTFDDFNSGLRPLCFATAQEVDAGALMKANGDVAATARALAASASTAEATSNLDELGRRLRAADLAARALEDDLGVRSG